MNLQRFAGALALVLALAACSGSEADAQGVPDTAAVQATVAPQTTAVIETSPEVAPTTSQATAPASPVVTSTIPESLAFQGVADVGSLFEVDGDTTVTDAPAGEFASSIADSTLVRVVQTVGREGELWVLVVDTADLEAAPIGWVRASSLRDTNRSVVIDDPASFGELLRVAGSVDRVDILTAAGGTAVAGELEGGEVALHGGSTALSADGRVWLDVLDPDTRTRIGWVPEQLLVVVRSTFAHDQDFGNVATSPEPGVTYGAPLVAPQVSLTGCNAVQVEIRNDSALGLAVLVGLDAPVGQAVGDREVWVSRSGATFFARPGETITLTLAAESTNLWHFAGLDREFRAQADRLSNGSLVDVPATATSFEVIQVNAGACVTAPPDAPPVSDVPLDEPEEGDEQAALDELEEELNEQLNTPVDEQSVQDQLVEEQSVQDELDQQ